MSDHLDIVQRVRNSTPLDTSSTEAIFHRLLELLAALPPSEQGGLLRKDAGENIVYYAPATCNVSISRVCYPDGQLYKVFSDAGPNGANGPIWNDDGRVEDTRYIAVPLSGVEKPPPPPPQNPPPVDVIPLLLAQYAEIAQALARLDDRVAALAAKPDPVLTVPPITFPSYEAKNRYLGTITLTPKA